MQPLTPLLVVALAVAHLGHSQTLESESRDESTYNTIEYYSERCVVLTVFNECHFSLCYHIQFLPFLQHIVDGLDAYMAVMVSGMLLMDGIKDGSYSGDALKNC